MTKQFKLDEIEVNHCGGCRTNYTCSCYGGSFLVKYRTHLYQERVREFYSRQTKHTTSAGISRFYKAVEK